MSVQENNRIVWLDWMKVLGIYLIKWHHYHSKALYQCSTFDIRSLFRMAGLSLCGCNNHGVGTCHYPDIEYFPLMAGKYRVS